MKYILMMQGTAAQCDEFATWPKEDLVRHVQFMISYTKELKDAGVFVSTEGLTFPDQARLVRAGADGEPITDGVFPESKEFLAGYWIIDVESAEEAYRLAARASAAPGPGGKPSNMPIEVRPIMTEAPEGWSE